MVSAVRMTASGFTAADYAFSLNHFKEIEYDH